MLDEQFQLRFSSDQFFLDRKAVQADVTRQLAEQGITLETYRSDLLAQLHQNLIQSTGDTPDEINNKLAQVTTDDLFLDKFRAMIEKYTNLGWNIVEQRNHEIDKLLGTKVFLVKQLLTNLRILSTTLHDNDQVVLEEVFNLLDSKIDLLSSIISREIREAKDIETQRNIGEVLAKCEVEIIKGSFLQDSSKQVINFDSAIQIAKHTETMRNLSAQIVNCIQGKLTKKGLEEILSILTRVFSFKDIEIKSIEQR